MPAGTRIRANNVYGVVSDNPLTAGAVTYNSPQLPLMPAVVGAHAVVTLDPLREHGEPEIIVITAHTAAATVATIQRGQYGTVARSHPQGTLWTHAVIDEDVIEVVTLALRPTNPYEGQFIYQTDNDKFAIHNGTAWRTKDLEYVDRGTTNVVLVTQNGNSGTINFNVTFAAVPTVVATVQIGGNLDVNVNLTAAPSTTSVGVRVFQNTGVSISGTAVVNWVAVGPVA